MTTQPETPSTALLDALTRGAGFGPGRAVALEVEDAALREALAQRVVEVGGRLAGAADAVDAAVISVGRGELASAHLVPPVIWRTVARVPAGTGRVALLLPAAGDRDALDALIEAERGRWGLGEAVGLAVGERWIVGGLRRPDLSRAEVKRLRGLGHALEATVLVGRGGLTEAVVSATRRALERHGLVKTKLTPQASLDKQEAASALAAATGAYLVQRIGKTALLRLPSVPLDLPQPRGRR